MSLLADLRARRDEILKLAAECGLTDVRVFGSVARGEERADSDIDLLVSYLPDSGKGWEVFGFPRKVQTIMGRKVDMVFEKGLYYLLRERILQEARPL